MDRTDIAKRMKTYEAVAKTALTRRLPVIIRIDGKAHHSFTRGLRRPFDDLYMASMQKTMLYLCTNIQGCMLGYTQSDEISLLLVDYKKLTSSAWFDNEVQKICSIAASMVTMKFNQTFSSYSSSYINDSIINEINNTDEIKYCNTIQEAADRGAMFDARCFTLPKEEVANYFFWRQYDATKNAIQMVGRAYFSHNQLNNKNCSQIQEMLFSEHGVNFNDFPVVQKRGTCCIRTEDGYWNLDMDIPIFKGEGRQYIEERVYVNE